MNRFPKLERYNQIVWAVIGSGVVVVATVSILAGLGTLLYSIFHTDRGGMQVNVIDEDAAQAGERKPALYDFCQPLAVYRSPYQLIRVVSDQFAMNKVSATTHMRKLAYESYSSAPVYDACRIYGSDLPTGTVNVIVRHAGTNAMKLLLKENAIIHSIEYPQPPAGRAQEEMFPPVGSLYWEMSVEDGNGDGVIDMKDDAGAFLADQDGSRAVRITPAQSRVLEKSYDGKRKLLTLRILRDTNQDKTLDEQDKPSLIEVDVAKRKMIREVLDSKLLDGMMQKTEPRRR